MEQVINSDAIDALKNITDKSVDMVLTDPPYNIGKAAWDKIKNYTEWCGLWLKECERVLKPSGNLYFFHNNMTAISRLMCWIEQNTELKFRGFIIWQKPTHRKFVWANPGTDNKLASWFSVCEYILHYTFASNTGLEEIQPLYMAPYLDYMTEQKKLLGWSCGQINKYLGYDSIAMHWFWLARGGQPQPSLINPADYAKLQQTGFFQRPYDALRQQMEGLRQQMEGLRQQMEGLRQQMEGLRQQMEGLRPVHNTDPEHNNIWTSTASTCKTAHPTEKPVDILKRIINCGTHPGGLVLDPFAGSGSTGVACQDTGRRYILIEKNEEYYQIIKDRLNKNSQITMFSEGE